MFTNPSFTLADQLFWIVDCFCKSMARDACTRRIGSLSVAIWTRVKGFERRFCALYSMWKAGTLPKGRLRKDTSPRPSPQSGEGAEARGLVACAFDPMARDAASLDRARLRPASVLPRALGWLHRLLPTSAPPLTGGMLSLLHNYPEMQAFVADVPQAGRLLRPICRMVGLKPPEWLALPKRVRRADPPPQPSPSRGEGEEGTSPRPTGSSPVAMPHSPHSGEGEERRRRRRTAREIAEDLVRRSDKTGKPVDFRKTSPVVLGYILHMPRDGNCPPPEIGYGGRRWRPPKDYKPPRDWD